MASKRKILETFSRQVLLDIAKNFEITGLTGKSKAEIIDALVGVRSVSAEAVLGLFSREDLKTICRDLDLDDKGREKQRLIDRLLGRSEPPPPHEPTGEDWMKEPAAEVEALGNVKDSLYTEASVFGNKTCTKLQLSAMLMESKRPSPKLLRSRGMRGRRPGALTIRRSDKSELERIAHSDSLPWFRVRRARIALGIAAGRRREVLATELDCDEATIWRTCQRYRSLGLSGLLADQRQGNSGRELQITPVQRAQIVELACLEPVAKGLHITHWSSDDLGRQAVADGIVAGISARTVRYILADVDLQPHRTRYWKTARLDAKFKERAEQVLWCYGNAARLATEGKWVVCVDEIPTFQVLERNPIRRAIPGSIEQQEFDYTRHGTVNILVFLVVHTGLMELVFLKANDQAHYIPELELFRKQHRELREVFLVQDGGASHVGSETQKYFAKNKDWWKPRFTPANASWLNQAEILIHAFKHYYLKRASWSRQEEFKTHVMASWPEYNHRYAHPFEWTWTNQRMRRWFAKHAAGI